MATRDELYQKFGPIIIEAVIRILFNEINTLRQNAGLPARTVQQAIDALETQIGQLSKYGWMNSGE